MEFGGYQRISVGETCYRCLESRDVHEKRLLGICVSWRPQAVPLGGRSGLYQQIWDVPCTHGFVRGGFCRESGVFTHLITCGAFAKGSYYRRSNLAVASIFDTYRRTGSKDLARRTYRLLFAQDVSGFGPREWPLDKFTTEKEWTEWLASAEREVGLHVEANGPPPLEHGSHWPKARTTKPAE
jgi:hypothetical protein